MEWTVRFDPPSPETLNRAVGLVVSACRTAFAQNLVCVTLKGSAVKGDFIPGYSDFDFHVFLKPEVMDGEDVPKAKYAVQFQRAFGQVDPADFEVSQFQIYFINSEKYPEDWAPPIKETYRILWGSLPETAKELDDDAYIRFAEQHLSLSSIEYSRRSNVAKFVDKPDTQIAHNVRLVGATLKNYMYSISILLTKEPKAAFKLELDKMITMVEKGIGSEGHFSNFFEYVSDWDRVRQDHDYARKAFTEGIKALDEIAHWATR